MALKPIFELGVDEAHAILTERFGVVGLPPLVAIENEDWGRDLLLGRLAEFSPEVLGEAGLTLSSGTDAGEDASDSWSDSRRNLV